MRLSDVTIVTSFRSPRPVWLRFWLSCMHAAPFFCHRLCHLFRSPHAAFITRAPSLHHFCHDTPFPGLIPHLFLSIFSFLSVPLLFHPSTSTLIPHHLFYASQHHDWESFELVLSCWWGGYSILCQGCGKVLSGMSGRRLEEHLDQIQPEIGDEHPFNVAEHSHSPSGAATTAGYDYHKHQFAVCMKNLYWNGL